MSDEGWRDVTPTTAGFEFEVQMHPAYGVARHRRRLQNGELPATVAAALALARVANRHYFNATSLDHLKDLNIQLRWALDDCDAERHGSWIPGWPGKGLQW